MTNVVTVGCKLPHGLVAQLGDVSVTFNGLNSSNIIGGHGITEDVPAEFWAEWSKRNSGLAYMQKGLIFADAKPENTKAKAKERQNVKTGLEQIDPTATKEVQPLKE